MALKEKEENSIAQQESAEISESSVVEDVEKKDTVSDENIELKKEQKSKPKNSILIQKEEPQEIKPIETSENALLIQNTENALATKPEAASTDLQKIEPNFKQPVITKPKSNHKALKVFESTFLVILALILLVYTIFTIMCIDNSKVSSGISILGIDVSGLERDAATDKISAYIQESLGNNDIILKHNDFETNIGPEQIETKVNVSSAINAAYEAGSDKNIFLNSYRKLSLMFNPVDIKPVVNINTEQLENALNDISTQLPDAVKQSDYYVENGNLIVTSGKSGVIINTSTMQRIIIDKINDLSFINTPINLEVIEKSPDAPNIENIYNEIHKLAKDAHFDTVTRIVYPEETGVDFDISLDEAKAMLAEEKEEYTIPLKTLYPSVTTKMIGMEAFPDLLSTFSTKYPASNRDRTTNLRLAANKVNGTVLLPGETFSYNAVVGARTIAAGYKEAAIYQDGQVVQGIGGGICQISSTLFNAALYANLEIVERRNHQFVPSYVGAGRDATVVYGSQDFRFKNNRNYAIKITCSVEGGIANFQIFGIEEPDEYEVVISSSITSRNANSFTSATYKTLKQNGEVVSSETIARDTYKVH